MEQVEVNTYLINEDLFGLFKKQLKKDFETVGIDAGFAGNLLPEWFLMRELVSRALQPLSNNNSLLTSLLYRVDISETELEQYRLANIAMKFEDLLAELIIKRILQKVILKKRFSD